MHWHCREESDVKVLFRKSITRGLLPMVVAGLLVAIPIASTVEAGASVPSPTVSSMIEELADQYQAAQQKAAILANDATTSKEIAVANDAAEVVADTYKFVTAADNFINAEGKTTADQVEAAENVLDAENGVYDSAATAAAEDSVSFADVLDSFSDAMESFGDLVNSVMELAAEFF